MESVKDIIQKLKREENPEVIVLDGMGIYPPGPIHLLDLDKQINLSENTNIIHPSSSQMITANFSIESTIHRHQGTITEKVNEKLSPPDKFIHWHLNGLSVSSLALIMSSYTDKEIEDKFTRKDLYYVMNNLFPFHTHCSMTKKRMIKHIRFFLFLHPHYKLFN